MWAAGGGHRDVVNLLQHMEAHVNMWLPDPSWSGDSGIDFELWTPIWEEMTMPASVGFHSVRYQPPRGRKRVRESESDSSACYTQQFLSWEGDGFKTYNT